MPGWVDLLNLAAKTLFCTVVIALVVIVAWAVYKTLTGGAK